MKSPWVYIIIPVAAILTVIAYLTWLFLEHPDVFFIAAGVSITIGLILNLTKKAMCWPACHDSNSKYHKAKFIIPAHILEGYLFQERIFEEDAVRICNKCSTVEMRSIMGIWSKVEDEKAKNSILEKINKNEQIIIVERSGPAPEDN